MKLCAAVLLLLLAIGLGVWSSGEVPRVGARRAPQASVQEPELSLPASYQVLLDGADAALEPRVTTVDLVPVIGREQRVEVVYDVRAVIRPTTFSALEQAPEWTVGVRLLLGEMGVWRLRTGRWSLLEGVGILETVNNRFEPDLSNPLRIEGVRAWPGCGVGGTFTSCIDPEQYLGLNSARALRPAEAVSDRQELLEGLDRAVAAWFVYEEALLGETVSGATSFVHRCGGSLYGAPTTRCVGPGAEPSRGPILFRGPSVWLADKGRYALEDLALVDFHEGERPTQPRAYVDYLLGGGP